RRIEALLLGHALRVTEPAVIGCGGGIVTRPEARALLRNGQGLVVWLRAEPATLAARLQGATDRPLLDGDPLGNLTRLAAERAAWYAEVADVVVDVDSHDVDDVVTQIVASVAA
ncbi:MAG TPA: shikimate kinase, partial [Acidimicrobiales bacterium]